MTNHVLKYNTYHEIISSHRNKMNYSQYTHTIPMFNENIMILVMRISMILIIALVGIFIIEKSLMVFSQRAVISTEQKALVAEKEVSSLEITTTQLSAAPNLTEIALEEKMVIPHEVSYLNIEGGSVALVK